MNSIPSEFLHIEHKLSSYIKTGKPIVALETAVLTHGLPFPDNLDLSKRLETEIRQCGAIPATIGVIGGKLVIGLNSEQMEILAKPDPTCRKISRRDFGIAIAKKMNGGTTVSGTLIAAHQAGLKVFSTGGIGGVHRGNPQDVSADLPELSRTPMVVVCAGAKAILDIPATLEYLETMGVPVVGYQTDQFPAFYSRDSGLSVNIRVDDPVEVVAIANAQWKMGLSTAILVVTPPPADVALDFKEIDSIIQQAVREAQEQGVLGSAITPFLLDKVNQISAGSSMMVNLSLLRNNARLAAQIALQFSRSTLQHI